MAALIATRLTKFAVNSLCECCCDMPIHLWSDSRIVFKQEAIEATICPTLHPGNHSDIPVEDVELLSYWR